MIFCILCDKCLFSASRCLICDDVSVGDSLVVDCLQEVKFSRWLLRRKVEKVNCRLFRLMIGVLSLEKQLFLFR